MSFTSAAKRHLLVGSAATALVLAISQGAHAQSAEETETGDVVVATGIRQSIADSLNLKKNSSSIVEAITAEDIGKLPDVSIADSLARLPGVTAQRVRGRAQQISIRGLGPDFSIALLNGREVVSAGNNRGIEFDQFPSELISQGVVYKTPDARLAATGVAGAVDLRTVRPLDKTERSLTVSGKYVVNDNGSLNPDFPDDGYRLFGAYVDQFADNRIGIALAITDQSNPTQFTSRELKTSIGQTEDFEGLRIPRDNPRTGSVSRDFERTSVAGTLEFRPNDRFQMTGDVLYTDAEDSGIFRGIETPIASWSGADVTSATGGGPFADSVTYDNVGPILRTDTEGNEVETLALGLNTSFEFTDKFRVVGDFATSSLERTDVDYESYAGAAARIIGSGNADLLDTLTFDLPDNGEYSVNSDRDYTSAGNVLLTDPGGWGQVGFLRSPDIEDDLDQIRLEAEYDLDAPFVSSVVAGFIQTDRRKSFTDNAFFLRASDRFQNGNNDGPELAIPSDSIIGATDDNGTGLPIIAYDPSSFLTNGIYDVEQTNATAWLVNEDIDTFYGMINIDGLLGDVPVRGNIGMQYVDTTQSSVGTNASLGPVNADELNTVSFSYDDWLPSVNLGFEVMEDTYVKVAFAETITRARLDQLASNTAAGLNPTVCTDVDGDQLPDNFDATAFTPSEGIVCLGFSGGNALLKPYHSTSYDLSVEKYFGDASALSVAVYHKDLSEYIQNVGRLFDASAFVTDQLGQGFLDNNPGIETARIDGPLNVGSGSLTGVEVSLRMSLDDVLPDTLRGFGLNASYTYTDSNLDIEDASVRIPGFSKNVASGEVYFERAGFRARVNGRYRDGFLSEIQRFDGGLDGAEALSEFILDAQIGYEWEDGPLEGFGINLEAYNLTDEPFRTEDVFNDNGDTFVSRYEDYGRTYNITVSKKF